MSAIHCFCVLFVLPILMLACAHSQPRPSAWVEFCDTSSCYENGVLEEGAYFRNCLVTDAQAADTCWQEVTCVHPNGQEFSGPITEFKGDVQTGDKVGCEVMPLDSGMYCQSLEVRPPPNAIFVVSLLDFAGDLREAGFPMEKGHLYENCWLQLQGVVTCHDLELASEGVKSFFHSEAFSGVKPKFFPPFQELECEVINGLVMRCRAAPIDKLEELQRAP